jgi:hypothetical protein
MKLRLSLAAALVALGFTAAPSTPGLQETIQALQGGLTALPAEAAVENIDGWREALAGSDNPLAREVYTDLGLLKDELTSGSIDGERVGLLLVDMGVATQRLSIPAEGETAAGLSRLGGLLVDAGYSLL